MCMCVCVKNIIKANAMSFSFTLDNIIKILSKTISNSIPFFYRMMSSYPPPSLLYIMYFLKNIVH